MISSSEMSDKIVLNDFPPSLFLFADNVLEDVIHSLEGS